LADDPTQNGMMAFVRSPTNLNELEQAAQYRKDCFRSPDCTRATWLEWGNVRYSKQYAEFLEDHHSYAFDHLGHLGQHWTHFNHYIRESRKDLPLKNIILSENFAMNLFMVVSMTFQLLSGFVVSLPSAAIARVRHGIDWRKATDLTALERYEAKVEKEYAEFLDTIPFYMFPYLSKISKLWSTIWNSDESYFTKLTSALSATSSTIRLGLTAAICAPIKMMYTTQDGQYVETDRVAIIVHDHKNQLKQDPIYKTQDGYKLIFMPRYKPFTDFLKELASLKDVTLIKIAGQPKVTLDVLYEKDEKTDKGNEFLYEMDRLQDPKKRHYATYQVETAKLLEFINSFGPQRIEYVHE
jgi:hypothetical protein